MPNLANFSLIYQPRKSQAIWYDACEDRITKSTSNYFKSALRLLLNQIFKHHSALNLTTIFAMEIFLHQIMSWWNLCTGT